MRADNSGNHADLLPLKICQKTAFAAKKPLYTTGKAIQRLFSIHLYTQLAIYGYR